MRALAILVALSVFMACLGDDPDTSSSSGGSANATPKQVRCNATLCAVGDVCCLTLGTTFVDNAECTPPGAGCPTGIALVCDDTSDCPSGQVCCAKTNGNSVRYGPSFCNAKCDVPDRQLCRDGSECGGGKGCSPPQASVTPTGLMECGL
jgi:hypothetical protein